MRIRSAWRIIVAAALAFGVFWMGYLYLVKDYAWADWTGFGGFTDPTNTYHRGITLWGVIEIMIIPVALAIGAWYLNKQERESERAETRDRVQGATLQSYLDKMSDLMLRYELKESSHRVGRSKDQEVLKVAQARTVSVLRSLDREQRDTVFDFLRDAGLAGFILKESPLRGIDLSGSRINGITLSGANLLRANLSGAQLYEANLSGANLVQANLYGAHLLSANLSGADLSGADLRGAPLSGANLSGADLSGADLRGAQLRQADLSGADLSGALLYGALLYGADLSGADLSVAHLYGADLSGADLSRAEFTREQLAEAKNVPEKYMEDG